MLVPMIIMSVIILVGTTLISMAAGGVLGLGTGVAAALRMKLPGKATFDYGVIFAVIGAIVSIPSWVIATAVLGLVASIVELPGGPPVRIGIWLGVWGVVLVVINLGAFAVCIGSLPFLTRLANRIRDRWFAA